MHEFLFADAVRPARVVCLRLPLRPYTIGHELLLMRYRNPLLTDTLKSFQSLSPSEQSNALRCAVMICANTWEENHKKQHWLRLWAWRSRGCDLDKELQVFRDYLADGHASFPGPDDRAANIVAKANGYAAGNSCGRMYGAPLVVRLMLFVSRTQAVRPSEVYDFPLGLANMLYEAQMESDGSARIENLDEFDEKENLAKIEREWREEQKLKAESATPGIVSLVPEELKSDKSDAAEGSAG